MPLQGNLNTERICQLSQVSRAGFYRYLKGRAATDEEMEVRSAIQEIAMEHRRRYGYRRITAELRERGMLVNHKRVLRIMAEDKLLMALREPASVAPRYSVGRCRVIRRGRWAGCV